MFKKILASLIILLSAYTTWWYLWPLSPAMIVSVSPDGQHVITSHQNRTIALWDIAKQQKKILSRWGNIYSAYFINNDTYMYQTLLFNRVKVKQLNGKTLLSFNNFPAYGHVMTQDLKHYIASDAAWNVYRGYNKQQQLVKDSYSMTGSLRGGKLFNIALDDKGNHVVTAGSGGHTDLPLEAGLSTYDAHNNGYMEAWFSEKSILEGVVLWDTSTGQPQQKFAGNRAKTNATISPDGRFVVGGSEGGSAFVWDTQTGKQLFRLYSLLHGKLIKTGSKIEDGYWDNSSMTVFPPENFLDRIGLYTNAVLALKFINHSEYYLRFTTYIPYAILYHIDDPKPLAYFPLDGERPSVDEYLRNSSIATAPHAGVLVTGQSMADGINVYHYNAEAQTLELSWSAS